MKIKAILTTIGVYVLALSIPSLLVLDSVQAKRFAKLEQSVKLVEGRQYELIEANKRLVAGISILSSPERIEFIAKETLNMRSATPDEIIRVEVKRN